MRKLRSIQVLRAIAASSVVYYHSLLWAVPALGNAPHLGAAGVDLFFVISGFIMANLAKDRTAGQFLFDRFWRIYPLWWTASIPSLLVLHGYGTDRLAASLTLWPIWGPSFSGPLPGVGWTLCFEMLFYGAVALAMITRPSVPLAIFALALPFHRLDGLLGFVGNPIIFEFLFGVVIASLPRRAWAGLLVPAGLVAFWLAPFGGWDFPAPAVAIYRVLFWGVPAAAVVYGALCLEPFLGSGWWSVPVLLGDASYSIYLFHPLIIQWALLPWFVEFFGAVAIGLGLHFGLERPIIKLKPRRKEHGRRLFTNPSTRVSCRECQSRQCHRT